MFSETVLSGLSNIAPWLIAMAIVLGLMGWLAKKKTHGSKGTRLTLILLCAFLLIWIVQMMLR
jgi:FtsH-binding integral membrane protein